MEDFSTIVVIVLAIVSGIFSFIKEKNKDKQPKKTVSPEDIMDEAFGEEAPAEVSPDAGPVQIQEGLPVQAEPVSPAGPVYSPIEESVSIEQEIPEVHKTIDVTEKKKYKVDPVKMIIYSEILRPKYLEGNETK